MRKDWIKMPMWIFTETKLSPTEACVLALLIDRAKLRNWETSIAQKEIADQLNISRSTTIRALDELERAGLIAVKRTGKQSIYQISDSARIEQQRKEPDEYGKRIKLLQHQADVRDQNERKRAEGESSFTLEDIEGLANKFGDM